MCPYTPAYGQRQRPMRASRRKLLESLLPQVVLDLTAPFQSLPQPSWLEIGFGKGEHLTALASVYRDIGFIGCELYASGVANLLQNVQEQQLPNVRIATRKGQEVLAWLPAHTVAKIYILFPDPWPKRKHHKRRLLQLQTIKECARVLQTQGELILATDHQDYLTWIQKLLEQQSWFALDLKGRSSIYERPVGWQTTRYELKAFEAGRQPAYLQLVNRFSMS